MKYIALNCLDILNGTILGGSLFAASMYMARSDPSYIMHDLCYGMMAGGIISAFMRLTRD